MVAQGPVEWRLLWRAVWSTALAQPALLLLAAKLGGSGFIGLFMALGVVAGSYLAVRGTTASSVALQGLAGILASWLTTVGLVTVWLGPSRAFPGILYFSPVLLVAALAGPLVAALANSRQRRRAGGSEQLAVSLPPAE